MSLPAFSLVIPVYNANTNLPLLIGRIAEVVPAQSASFEVICVDDGSRDDSWNIIRRLAQEYPWLKGVKLACNMGQHPAILVGLQHARYPLAVTMDDDLQHPPEYIPSLLTALNDRIDIVYAAPQAVPYAWHYNLLTGLTKKILRVLCAAPFLTHMRSFKALRTGLYPWATLRIARHHTLDGLLASVRPRCAVIQVPYGQRLHGQSTYTWGRSARLALHILQSAYGVQKPGEAVARVAERVGGP